MVDPRRGMVAILAFAFFMVLVNHFVQLSTPRYGSWLSEAPAGATAAVQTRDEDVMVAERQ